MNRSWPRRVLLTILVVSGLSTLAGSSIAAFNATVVNGSNTFQSGTLVLKETAGSTVCVSASGVITDSNSSSCTTIDTLGGAVTQKPGGAAATQTVVVKNDGTINSATLLLWSGSCASTNAAGETYHGTADICTVTDLTIFDSTHSNCVYPAAGASCVITAGKTYSDFVTNHGTQGAALSLTALAAGAATTFVFSSQLEATAPNTMQGRTATVSFTWYMAQ